MCYTLHTHREEMRGGIKVGYAVVHMMKIKSGAVGGIQSHNNREHEPKTNPDVDMSRSEDNYDLVPCEGEIVEPCRKQSSRQKGRCCGLQLHSDLGQ